MDTLNQVINVLLNILIIAVPVGLIDLYVYKGLKGLMKNFALRTRKVVFYLYWGFTIFLLAFLLADKFFPVFTDYKLVYFFITFIILYIPKILALLFLVLDDAGRLVRWVAGKFTRRREAVAGGNTISRSDFLVKTAALAAAVPVLGLTYGTLSGAYDIRIRRQKLILPNLPSAFDGIRIAQISDIHSGSFFNSKAVKGGVEMLLQEKPDMVFFTGDLINQKASEMYSYQDILSKVKAPLGVYSVLGNHDYGDSGKWSSEQAKKESFRSLLKTQELMGWKLLRNEHTILEQSGNKIAILGVENWGGGSFTKYADLQKTYNGAEEAAVKLLLSHDPSHWDAQVRPLFPDIDVTFAGHTHGAQFGIEIGDVKWSPSQYGYKQWAGHYRQENQHLYVNRGFGFIGIPTRLGILPEITLFELTRSS